MDEAVIKKVEQRQLPFDIKWQQMAEIKKISNEQLFKWDFEVRNCYPGKIEALDRGRSVKELVK